MEKLSNKKILLIGVTLFSMFFGAGNLIFPPYLSAMAGSNTLIALVGFCVTAVGFPILGVIVVARSSGLKTLAGRVHPVFAAVFTFLIYLSIGPMLAIPRTASTSFEMMLPFIQNKSSISFLRIIYSAVFFLISFFVALKPEKLSDKLGKFTFPCLLLLIAVIFFGTLFKGFNNTLLPNEYYSTLPFVKGFIDGYQTMDTIAALNFGIVIAINIRAMGVNDDNGVVNTTVKAGLIAAVLLLAVYSAIGFIGFAANTQDVTNGAGVLTVVVQNVFGKFGLIILAAIFLLACFNTCTGLICCCSEYFNSIFPKLSYKAWVTFFAVISMLISNIGLDKIISLSVPILNAIYPVAIVLIVLGLFHKFLGKYNKNNLIYKFTIFFTAVVGIMYSISELHIKIPVLTSVFLKIPFFEIGLGFVFPALIGVILGALSSKLLK